MIVQILSCGVHWWGLHPGELEDPYRFRRNLSTSTPPG